MAIENLGVKLYSGVKTDRVADSLGSSADGTVSGVTLDTTNQKLGSGCYSYDASSDSVDIPADINLGVTGTSSFTITGWFNLDSVGANREIFRNQVSNGQAKVEIYYTHGNQTIICDLGGTTTKILSKVETGKWYHLTIRRVSGDKDYFYINGQLSQTNSTQSDVTGASGSIWYIGNRKEKNEAMIGKLDDIGFFGRALEESEIQSLTNTTVTQGYKGGLGGDASPYSGGGGGGAGGAGGNGSSGVAGAGGIGKENPITGSEIGELNGGKYWLGGGGGGFGNTSSGAGGKGGGSGNNSGDNGTANTGGGAGARDGNTGAGGSGVVLVSYQTSQITDGSSDGSLETGSNIPSGYAIRKFVLTGSSTENFDFVISSGSGNVQYVIVGGGGGGGTDSYSSARASGGGGGGGFVTGTKSMSAGTYSVTVGRGGADTTNGSNNDGGDGDNSVFDGTTAYGGGGGATHYSSESSGFWGRAGCKGTGGGGNNSAITRGLAVYNTDTGALVSSLSNKAGLKAHYTMNTEGTQAYTGFTKTDDFSLSSYETQPRACTLSADGTYFYVVGDQGHSVDQFTMSTPYDLTTISHTRVQALGTNNPRGIYFKEDGTKMFVSYYGGTIKRYSLSTAWNVSTIGSADQSDTFESDSGDYNSVIGLFFKPDGTKFYTVVASDNAIKEYTCGSAWNVDNMSGSDTATRDSLQADPSGLFISSDGLRLWYCDYATDKVYQWNLTTAWDISTGSIDSTSYSVEANPFGFTMKPDGTKFYLVNEGEDEIQEFTGGKSCLNDASATSELDGMTNLEANTIFFQTDDTPKYFWKQSDNTWKIDGTTAFLPSGSGLHVGGSSSNTSTFTATDYVWASSSVSTIGESRSYSSGAGNKNSFWIAGGSNAHTSRIFDGSSWSSTTALDTERRDTTAGGGSTSNAIIACGRNQSGTEISTSSKYNGTAWSSAGTVTGGAGEHVGGAGTGSSFLATGGSTRNDKCDKYDGTSWSASAVLPQTTVRSHNQAGKSSASAHTAGGNYASSFTWDGTSWATSTNYTQGGDTTVRYPTGGGTADHHWLMGGLDETGGTSTLNNTELWNGSSWTAKGALPTGNYAGLGDGSDF